MSGTNVGDALGDMWRSVLLFVPTALAFVAILLIGYVLARLIRTVVERALKRVGFDRAIERSGFGRALGDSPVTPGDLCAKIAFYGVLLFALQLAFGLWGPNAVSDLLTLVIAWLPRAFVAIVIVVVAVAIAGAARDLISAAFGGLAYGGLLAKATSAFIIGLGLIAALEQVGIATAVTGPLLIAVLATIAGVIIVGVGGGLVRPMQRRWEAWLERAGAESQVIREHARSFTQHRAAEAAARDASPLPADTESADTESADTGPIVAGPIITGPIVAGPADTQPTVRESLVPGLADPETVVPGPVVVEPVGAGPVGAGPGGAGPVVPGPVVLERGDADAENGSVTYVSAMAAAGASESERTQVIPVQSIAADPERTRDVSPAAGPEQPAVPSQEQTQVIRPSKPGKS